MDSGEKMVMALAQHIEQNFASEIPQHNGGLAVTLVERAVGQLAQRVVLGASSVRGGGALRASNARSLLPVDFGIGVSKGVASFGRGTAGRDHGRPVAPAPLKLPVTSPQVPVVQMRVREQLPPNTRVRTRRAPPKAAIKHKESRRKAPKKKVEEEEEEAEEEEEEEMTEAEALAALKKVGVCPESYQWEKRNTMEQTCGKCQGKRSHGRPGGYQCAGGSHWVCHGCLRPPTPEHKIRRFE
jgi:hypothetical protein